MTSRCDDVIAVHRQAKLLQDGVGETDDVVYAVNRRTNHRHRRQLLRVAVRIYPRARTGVITALTDLRYTCSPQV